MGSQLSESIIIIGAGVIGLSIAWRLARRGAQVSVYDQSKAGSGASYAAAGMLAACTEIEPGEEWLLPLNRESQRLWPAFADEVERASGITINLRQEGTLHVALNADESARLRHHLALQEKMALPVHWLSAAEVKAREPLLAGVSGGIWSPEDHQVDNRKLAEALRIAALKAGVSLHEDMPVERIIIENDCVCGVESAGERHSAATIVLAAGAWSRGIKGLIPDIRPPVRPIKGQMLALGMEPDNPLIRHVIWASGIYLVPRLDGRLIVGATAEERGFDDRITAGGILSLLQNAWRALPGIEELPLIEAWTGFRPGSRDDAPILGPSMLKGLVYATGHHRNGILQTPVTAEIVSRFILDGERDGLSLPFDINRFRQVAK